MMSRLKFCFIFFILILPIGALASVPVDALNADLRLGSDNQDVKTLQTLLNQDSATMVAITGAGSIGQETTYFGLKTRTALIKWQKKFGIVGERGLAGSKTRLALQNKYADWLADQWSDKSDFGVITAPQTTSSSTAGNRVSRPVISLVSPDNGGNGTIVKLKGNNFTSASNIVHTSYGDINNVSSTDGQTIQFSLNFPTSPFIDADTGQVELPGNLEIPIYIYIINQNGTSNEAIYKLKI